LIQLKLSYNLNSHNTKIQFYGGVDNLLNQLYSLGNDINAAGKRFYNPAPNRNLFIGTTIQFN